MGIYKAGMAAPELEDGKVRVFVDVDVANIQKEFQDRLDEKIASIPEGRNRDLRIEDATAEARLQYMDRVMAAALGQMQEERELAHRRLSGEDIDKKIAEKQAEIEKLEAEKVRDLGGEDEVAADVSARA